MRPNGPRSAPSPALAAAMSGAVDLAAVKARADAAARAAEAPAPSAGQLIVDVTEASFQTDVLDRSFQLPVLLALGTSRSPASEPLLQLLERLTTEANGAILLARIDVDANMRIVQALQVQGVPAVFAVIGGQLVPGFEGGLPEAQVGEFVAAVIEAGREAGLSGAASPDEPGDEADDPSAAAPAEPADPRFDAAEEALADGQYDLARQRFQAILDAEPANELAALAVRQVDLLSRVDGLADDAVSRADAAPDDLAAQLAAADYAFAGDDASAAMERLLAALIRFAGDDRDAIRARLVSYFELLGPDDPRVGPARRALAQALF